MDTNEYMAATRANIDAYQSCRDFLSRDHLGEYVLIYHGKIQGVFPSEREASLARGTANPWAVMRIVPTGEPVVERTHIRSRSLTLAA
jgi:hypothetical protein